MYNEDLNHLVLMLLIHIIKEVYLSVEQLSLYLV